MKTERGHLIIIVSFEGFAMSKHLEVYPQENINIWWTILAIENGPCEDIFPIKHGDLILWTVNATREHGFRLLWGNMD